MIADKRTCSLHHAFQNRPDGHPSQTLPRRRHQPYQLVGWPVLHACSSAYRHHTGAKLFRAPSSGYTNLHRQIPGSNDAGRRFSVTKREQMASGPLGGTTIEPRRTPVGDTYIRARIKVGVTCSKPNRPARQVIWTVIERCIMSDGSGCLTHITDK